jgi:hypothetical protein
MPLWASGYHSPASLHKDDNRADPAKSCCTLNQTRQVEDTASGLRAARFLNY